MTANPVPTSPTIARQEHETPLRDRCVRAVKAVVPPSVYRPVTRSVRRCRGTFRGAFRGRVRWGSLRRLEPVSRQFGFDRGGPIDRYYIERFLARHRDDIHGRVLEVGASAYTRAFGGDRVARSDVLHFESGHRETTILGDLSTGDGIPLVAFDCIVLTQVLPMIYDVHAAVRHCCAALRPGGVVLASLPGVSQISRFDMDRWGDYWRFTPLTARKLFDAAFAPGRVTVSSHGNVLAATAFLHGLGVDDVKTHELETHDPDYPVSICVRAVKAPSDKGAAA